MRSLWRAAAASPEKDPPLQGPIIIQTGSSERGSNLELTKGTSSYHLLPIFGEDRFSPNTIRQNKDGLAVVLVEKLDSPRHFYLSLQQSM